MCYPAARTSTIAEEMIERRREKLVLDALQDVVRSLRGVREERKAILAISNGWRLFRPNRAPEARSRRAAVRRRPAPSPSIRVPAGSRLTTSTRPPGRPIAPCAMRDRMALAQIDNAQQFRDIARGSEPRQRVVLSDRSARPRRVRRADHEAGHQRTAAAPCAAERRSGALWAHDSNRCARWRRTPMAWRSSTPTISTAGFGASSPICRRTTCSATTRRASSMAASMRFASG